MTALYLKSLCYLALLSTVVQAKPPNIVFILADDYGWNDVGYHGSEIQTPNMDKLAASGVKLENYFVQPICSPTRSQLLSGRYQIHTGLQHGIIWPNQRNALPIELPTIANMLKNQGYSTHMIGKWHVGYYKKEFTPLHRGFDSYFGYLLGSEDYMTHKRCFSFPSEDGDRQACGLDLHDGDNVAWNHTGQYSTELFTRKAEMVIENHVKQSNDKPLFMYLPYQAVHAPLEVPDRYLQKYANITDKNRRSYAGMVSALDEAIGNVTDTLKKNGLYDNTVIIFSTDNGGQVHEGGNNWPLRGWKGSLWDGGMKGVGFVHSSLLPNPGAVTHELLHVSDWFPTIVSLAGGNTTSLKLDGYNQWETISHGSSSPRKDILHNIDPLYPYVGKQLYPNTFDTRARAALRSGFWKIITGNPGNGSWVPPPKLDQDYPQFLPANDNANKNVWLFDISTDPLEKIDLSEKYPNVVKMMLDKLSAYNATAVPCRYPAPDPLADPKLHGNAWQPWVD